MRYPSYKRPIEYINNNPYLIYAVYPITSIKDAKLVKEWLGCDTAFKNNREGTYLFCDSIQDVSYESV